MLGDTGSIKTINNGIIWNISYLWLVSCFKVS
jgi:hypothetical protein